MNPEPKEPENPPTEPFIPEGYVLATDFEFVIDDKTPNAYENGQKGYYRYIGNNEYVVLPHEISGNILKDCYKVFEYTTAKGVASNNPNITNIARMFSYSETPSLDLTYRF